MEYNHRLHNKLHHKLLVCLLAISSPALADNDNVSNPVAAATGNVTNQAIQFRTMAMGQDNSLTLVFHAMELP